MSLSLAPAKARYDLAIFDFDGTLADSADWLISIFNSVADRYRFRRVSEEEIVMLRSRSSREVVKYLGIPAWKLPGIARHVRSLAEQAAPHLKLFDDVDGLLAGLQARGVKIAIVSSNGESTIRQVLGPQNAARVTMYACGASVFGKNRKFRKVAKALGVPPSRVACIGDETRDIEAAAKAGMTSVSVAWGCATPEALLEHKTAKLADDVAHLLRILVEPSA